MIVFLSSDNLTVNDAQYFSKLYRENVVDFSQLNLRELKDSRITFCGHGGENSYGGLDPSAFVNALKTKGLLHNSQIKTIDIIGCRIGQVDNDTSFVRRVAILLFQEGYRGKLNAFNNQISDKEMHLLTITSVGKSKVISKEMNIEGIPFEKKAAYDAEVSAMMSKDQENSLDDEMHEIKNAPNFASEAVLESDTYDKYSEVYYSFDNPREELDRNRNFQLDSKSFSFIYIFPRERQEIIRMLNNLLANECKERDKEKGVVFLKNETMLRNRGERIGILKELLFCIEDPINTVEHIVKRINAVLTENSNVLDKKMVDKLNDCINRLANKDVKENHVVSVPVKGKR